MFTMVSITEESLFPSSLTLFSCLIALVRSASTMWNKNDDDVKPGFTSCLRTEGRGGEGRERKGGEDPLTCDCAKLTIIVPKTFSSSRGCSLLILVL